MLTISPELLALFMTLTIIFGKVFDLLLIAFKNWKYGERRDHKDCDIKDDFVAHVRNFEVMQKIMLTEKNCIQCNHIDQERFSNLNIRLLDINDSVMKLFAKNDITAEQLNRLVGRIDEHFKTFK